MQVLEMAGHILFPADPPIIATEVKGFAWLVIAFFMDVLHSMGLSSGLDSTEVWMMKAH